MLAPSKALPDSINSPRHLSDVLGVRRSYLSELERRAGRHYHPFDLLRPGKKKPRHVDNPDRELKLIQGRILKNLLELYPLPDEMTGGIPSRSTKDHAGPHVSAEILVTLDIQRCFPSITNEAIFRVFRKHLRCGNEVAGTLTRLTTFQRHLPQGAPTSPYLCALSLIGLHADLRALAVQNGLSFSMYVDDIALSGPAAQVWIDDVVRLVQKHGHHVGREKIKIQPRTGSMQIVGFTINEKLSADSQFRKKLRQRILELADADSVHTWEISRVLHQIEHVRRVDDVQGAALNRFAEANLPRVATANGEVLKAETWSCPGMRMHRND